MRVLSLSQGAATAVLFTELGGRLDPRNEVKLSVSGASSGIGAATAVLFAELGARLALTGRNEVKLRQTAAECEKQSENKVRNRNAGDLVERQ